MKIHTDFEQGSLAWMQARAGVPTASEFGQLVTPKFEVRKGGMPDTYLAEKVAEWWLNGPLAGFNAFATEQGHLLEEEAKPGYTLETGDEVQKVAFCTTDDGRVGCSPDGLIGDDGGVEIKSPQISNHVKYLLAGKVPDDYVAQVQGSLFVTGRKWWRFFSYCRKMPSLILTVEPDPVAQGAITDALAKFLARFESAKARLIELNGGPPAREVVAPQIGASEQWRRTLEQVEDIIP